MSNENDKDGCELDFKDGMPTLDFMIESLLIPKGKEEDEDED